MKKLLLIIASLNMLACTKKPLDIEQQQSLGRQLFFDTILSNNKTQSCATCHNPEYGFIDNRDNGVKGSASLGDDGKSLGDRNTPSAAYAQFSPKFHFDKKSGEWIGGQFLDGRETNLTGQAGEPPLNPIEMNMPNKQILIARFKSHPIYQKTFKSIYGDDIFNEPDKAYQAMTQSIAAFEKTKIFAPFDSKYDRYLKGEYQLNGLEDLGRSLFFSNNNTNCANCHQLKKRTDSQGETFSNYEYHNIGVPINTQLRSKNKVKNIDHGLLNNSQINNQKQDGKFKTPSLRNVAITAPYMHNGVFQNLITVIEFYDKYINKNRVNNPETRKPWATAEVAKTVNFDELKKGKKLSDRKIKALIAFLKILTDKRYEHLISN